MRDADPLGQRPRRRFGVLILHAGQQARQRDVVANGERRQQVEELEDEADLFAPHPRQSSSSHRREIAILEPSVPLVGRSIAPHKWRSVDLPQPDGPISADEIAGLDLERHAASAVTRASPVT